MGTLFKQVGVVGAGAMGQGIAQMAVQAGTQVRLLDAAEGAAAKAIAAIHTQWQKGLEKGRLTADQVSLWQQRLLAAKALPDLFDSDLVIEAVVENPTGKESLFQALGQGLSNHEIGRAHV